jgi:outer membrane protein assembly factor BamB
VEVLPETARLLWSIPLAPGEKLWGAPTFDRFGRVYLGLGGSADTGGRLLVVAADGTLAGSAALEGSPGGGLALVSGAVVSISRTGEVELFGELDQDSPSTETAPGRVRVFSWRVR